MLETGGSIRAIRYTIIVETNTRAGAMGEHSPCDAFMPSIVADYAVTQSIIPESFSSPEPPFVFFRA
jgi:carnitine O-acetyltransferase